MGCWGDEIWESDYSLDFLGTHVRELARIVDEDLNAAIAVDNPQLHRDAVAAVAILNALAKCIPSVGRMLEKVRVRKWRRDYFEWFEKYFVPANGPSEEYRAATEKEFSELLERLAFEDFET